MIAYKDIPNLQFNLDKTENISKLSEYWEKLPEHVGEVVDIVETVVAVQTVSRKCTNRLQTSKDHEHSRNLLSSPAGAALLCTLRHEEITAKTANIQENC